MVCFEAQEDFGHSDVLADTPADTAGIVEDEPGRDAADPVEEVLQAMRDAFSRLAAEELNVTGVAVGEAHTQELVHPLLTAGIHEVGFAEVHLRFARLPDELDLCRYSRRRFT
ncbi:hypothetical protein [Cohnella lubricantis]|uniref:Uncharacterized protein n=1 Tax=Cohnella lubricantis TaxID=2163172 RepID=A0A841TGV3_9BACL|nr:hypothetical protein [Cohnella lubricantis]MBB6679616.1 hypothetical protein [Cohnella lubricantis]MBP2120668.1 hypothetical protein [Cohnella lubricantis]